MRKKKSYNKDCPVCKISLCGESFYCKRHRPFSTEHRRKISLSKKGNKASLGRKLSTKQRIKLRDCHLGEKNPMWKGGVTLFIQRIRLLKQYKRWREKILKRDCPCLTLREIRKKKIQVHHLKPVAQILQENFITTIQQVVKCKELWDINNGVAIKKGEHLIITQLQRLKYPTKNFLKFIKRYIELFKKKT